MYYIYLITIKISFFPLFYFTLFPLQKKKWHKGHHHIHCTKQSKKKIIFSHSTVNSRLLDTSVACDQHNFMLSINFDVPFRGLIYSEEGLPNNCIYVNGTMLSQLNYHLKVPLNGCETKINSDGNFENGVIIQENIGFLQATDKKYLLTCIPSSPLISSTTNKETLINTLTSSFPIHSTTTTTISFGEENEEINVEINKLSPKLKEEKEYFISTKTNQQTIKPLEQILNNNNNLISTTTTIPSEELKYLVEIKNGHSFEDFEKNNQINSALNIGDPISYLVRIQKPISDSQIGRCWATDSNSSLELSDERGCSLQPKGNIWGAFERKETQNEVIFINRIKAWAFPTSNEVNIFCNLRICMSKHCSFVENCSDNLIRQRREENNGEIKILKKANIKLFRQKRNNILIKNEQQKNSLNNFWIDKICQMELNKSKENNLWCISLNEMLIVCFCSGLLSILIAVRKQKLIKI
ncbi:ZP domain-containing protein [Meloidogyne graminicola]|uniref:ZP domain-containing protein n=1 Tax=Meloidogyne graminicola TaxID=189291 RepID=A0A8S9ZL51_9BILA|nr:ZP domain-containing protein [Meloidogyne graminicola]